MNIELLQAAAAANQIAMVKNHLRYEWLRHVDNEKLALHIFMTNADQYLDAAIDSAMAAQTLKAAERAA